MTNLEQKLNELLHQNQGKDRNQFTPIISEIVTSSTGTYLADIKTLLQFAAKEQTGLLISRTIFNDFIKCFQERANEFPREESKQILTYATELMEQRTVAFEEQISQTREFLASIYEDEQEWSLAAQTLRGIPLDSGTRTVSNEYKLGIFIRICRLYLEDEDSVSADQFLNRAQMLDPQDRLLQIQLIAAQAKSFDFKRQFIPSGLKYYEISLMKEIHESEQLEALISACVCAVLAGAGPQRSQLLATLYKDERILTTPELQKDGVALIVANMHLGRICRANQVKEFQSILKEHQLALLPDGSTVFDRAIMEHNMQCISKLYVSVTFNGLGRLLSSSSSKAEALASKMISEDRISGKIDQVSNILYFNDPDVLEKWDEDVTDLLQNLEDVVSHLKAK